MDYPHTVVVLMEYTLMLPSHARSVFTRPLHLLVALAVLFVPMFGFVLTAHAANYTVTSLADSGPNTLRQALLDANGTPEAHTITFDVTGTIVLQSTLPTIVGKITINGPGRAS